MHTTDSEWENLGKENPYYGVLTDEKYKTRNLNGDLKKVFFETGEEYTRNVFSIIKSIIKEDFNPKKALDFGCGVGRLTLPIAKHTGHITGVDVSLSILEEAKKNAIIHNITNADFTAYSETLFVEQKFDFINTYIVLQHIPVKRGTEIIKALIGALNKGGIAVIHLTFSNTNTKGIEFRKRFNHWRAISPAFNGFTKLLRKAIKGIPLSDPIIQMNYYDLNKVFKIIYDAKAELIYHQFTNHAEVIGSILFIKKSADKNFDF